MFEDWGTQNDTMISPELWREFFGLQYRRITGAAHENNMDFWLHSCGKVTKLIDEFIDVKMVSSIHIRAALAGMRKSPHVLPEKWHS